jgi:hypothetical protein
MTENESEWFGELPAADVALLEWAPGGALSEAGRQAAIEASLSLLGVYFSRGDQELVARSAVAVSVEEQQLDALRAGLRLRVGIAAGRRLGGLLDAIVKRPTFRYELRTAEHVGSLSGALDINRWVTQPRGEQDVSFPVLEVRRGLNTPENVLAAYAVKWLLDELQASLAASLATADVIEYQVVHHLRERLTRAIQVPALAGCVRAAAAVRTRSAAERLVRNVKRRLRRREIANAGPYDALASWVDACLGGKPAVSAGEVDLALYGDRFDHKLFELWCLGALGRGLAAALQLPEPTVHPGWRRLAPAYSFQTFSGGVDVYFQRSAGTVDERHAARWRTDGGRRLGGIPDIVARARPTFGDECLAIIDPKLRQRDRLPAEELYKILGYLQNFDVTPPVGAVLIYTTSNEAAAPDVLHDSSGGTLLSVALNPSAPAAVTATALDVVIRTLLELIDYHLPEVPPGQSAAPAETDDERAEQVIDSVRTSVASWGRAHLGEIASSRERIETLIGELRWRSLGDDVQIMMATADLIGHQLDPVADFSGPVIGLCAAVEHVIYANVIAPAIGNDATRRRQMRTFGAFLDAIEVAARSGGSQLHQDIRAHVASRGVDLDSVSRLIPLWRRLNTRYRVSAAHREVLSKADWQQLYRMVLGSDNLFLQTFDCLHGS